MPPISDNAEGIHRVVIETLVVQGTSEARQSRLSSMTAPDAERFDALAPIYDQVVPFFGPLGERLVEWMGPMPGQRVLDLGAGRGAVTSALSQWMGPAADIVAGDVSTEMLSRLRSRQLLGVTVKYLDATAIDEPDGSFDVVFSAFVLHFLADKARALTEVARVLRPTGTFVMSVPGPDNEGWWVAYGHILDEFRVRCSISQGDPAADGPVAENGGHRRAQDRGPGDRRRVHRSRWTRATLGLALGSCSPRSLRRPG